MTRRPAALHGRDNAPPAGAENTRSGSTHFGVPDRRPLTLEEQRTRVAAERERALEYLRYRSDPVYSGELAQALTCSVSHAKSLLIGLERLGYLDSTWHQCDGYDGPQAPTGLGRRYYRLKVPA
jgi:hypothetical protein